MEDIENTVLSDEKISHLRNNLQNPDMQKQIKDINDNKIIEKLCKDPAANRSGLTARKYCLKLIELLPSKFMDYIDFACLENDMDSWIVKNNLKYVNSEGALRAIYNNIKKNNNNKTQEEQKQNMLDFLNLCPQLMEVFEDKDLELFCDEIINKNVFCLWQCVILHNSSCDAYERFLNYLKNIYDHNKKVKFRDVLYLYIGELKAGLCLYGCDIPEYKDNFCAEKYQEDVELCSKSLINIFKLKSTNSSKRLFLAKLFRWKLAWIALELFLVVLFTLGLVTSAGSSLGVIIFIALFGFVAFIDMLCGLFVPKKFIGSLILSEFICVDTSKIVDIYPQFSINHLRETVHLESPPENITKKILEGCDSFLKQIQSDGKYDFIKGVKEYFGIQSLADILQDQREHFLGCFNYFALKKLDNYIKDNLFPEIKNDLKNQFLSCFAESENYEVCQQLIEEYFATDRVDDMIEIACKLKTHNCIFTEDKQNNFAVFMEKCIMEEEEKQQTSLLKCEPNLSQDKSERNCE